MPSLTHRPIRSYVLRQGRLTESQQRAIDQHFARYSIPLSNNRTQLTELQAINTKHYLEIGFGSGTALSQLAQNNRDCFFTGVEVHLPGVGHLVIELEKNQLENVRILHGDCKQLFDVIKTSIQFDGILIWFADPWPKRKHQKRRLIQPDFIQQLEPLLKPKGYLHLATDWQHYADWMFKVMTASHWASIENPTSISAFVGRPNSKYELRGIRLGHQVTDLVYQK